MWQGIKSQELPLVPYPVKAEKLTKGYLINTSTVIVSSKEAWEYAVLLQENILRHFGLDLAIKDENARVKTHFIRVWFNSDTVPSSYKLESNPQYIEINAGDRAGLFYGIMTLIQLFPADPAGRTIPGVFIHDFPRFSWRGMHLDCSRHFFTTEEIKKYLDYMALYKMNVFHWHLTDDQGWRPEIKKYPLLTQISSQRKETLIGRPSSHNCFDGKPYGGFYTQEEMKDIVAYAAKRHITVVPEIEMPGHSLAVLAAYPGLSCTGGPFETGTYWGVFDDVFCAGNEETFRFLEDILTEICDIFPGQYIHIGGDECPKHRWKECSRCQQRMKEENLKDEHELQSYFIQRIEKFLNTKGKQIIGWDEILEGGLAPNAAVMSWRGTQGGIEAARMKHYVVMTPGNPCYFDHYQHSDKEKEPLAIGGYNPLDAVYSYEPVPQELNAEESAFILGAQGNMWTEYMPVFSHVEYMALPRMAALSEVLWSPAAGKNYGNFLERLRIQILQLEKKGVNYRKGF
jgi:hexosaminidase